MMKDTPNRALPVRQRTAAGAVLGLRDHEFSGVSSSQQIDDGAKVAFRQIVGSD
jgi:hypothetical protein